MHGALQMLLPPFLSQSILNLLRMVAVHSSIIKFIKVIDTISLLFFNISIFVDLTLGFKINRLFFMKKSQFIS